MTTPVSDQPNLPGREPWNLLPVGQAWPFLILANDMASYLVGSRDRQLNYFAGQTAVLQLDPQSPYRSYALTVLDSPETLAVRLTPDLARQVLDVTSTDAVGNYRVRAGGSTSGVDRGFSVNLAPEQTRLERLSEEELAELFRPLADRAIVFGPIPYRTPKDRARIVRDVSKGRVGRELFPIAILLAALVLGVEHVLANRFYRN